MKSENTKLEYDGLAGRNTCMHRKYKKYLRNSFDLFNNSYWVSGTSTPRHIAKWVKIGSTPKQPLSRPGRLLNLSPARGTGPGVRMAATYHILLS